MRAKNDVRVRTASTIRRSLDARSRCPAAAAPLAGPHSRRRVRAHVTTQLSTERRPVPSPRATAAPRRPGVERALRSLESLAPTRARLRPLPTPRSTRTGRCHPASSRARRLAGFRPCTRAQIDFAREPARRALGCPPRAAPTSASTLPPSWRSSKKLLLHQSFHSSLGWLKVLWRTPLTAVWSTGSRRSAGRMKLQNLV